MTPDTRRAFDVELRANEEADALIDWDRIITALFSGGVTASSVFMFLIIMLSRGTLLTRHGHQEVVKTKEDRIAELELDRDQWRISAENERVRGDNLQVRVSEEVVPLIRVTNNLLESIRTVGGERNADKS